MVAFVNNEVMRVTSVSGNTLTVRRAQGSPLSQHTSGDTIYMDLAQYFRAFGAGVDLAGRCTDGEYPADVTPIIDVNSGNRFDCTGSVFVKTSPSTINATGTTIVLTGTSANTLTAGRLGSTTPAFNVDASAATSVTGLNVVAAASGGGLALSVTSSAGNEALTVNAKGTGTIGIGSVSTGAVTITPATTVTGAITPTGGVAAAGGFSASCRNIAVGGLVPAVSTDFTNSTPVITETYISEIFVPANCSATGIAVFNGSDVTGNMNVGLANSSGALVAESADTAGSGTDAYQRIPFTAPYAAKGPATYYILVQYSSGTARYNSPPLGSFGASVKTGETFGTFTTVTPPTTFTANVGNIASLY
jgi:hypothetical protein